MGIVAGSASSRTTQLYLDRSEGSIFLAKGTTSRAVIELQRLELKPESADEALRTVRELWEILRRKQGCTANRLYHAPDDRSRWLAYSEWQSMPQLNGARRELARSPIYRRMHSMLAQSSERAHEPFGAVLSVHGVSFGPETTALIIRFEQGPEHPAEAMAFVQELQGYLSHITMHEMGSPDALVCLAHFDNAANAAAAESAMREREPLRALSLSIETYVS
jgi:quinol monooxygenase YgiN